MKIKEKKTFRNYKVKVYKTTDYWNVQIDSDREPDQEGFDRTIEVESTKFQFNNPYKWTHAAIRTYNRLVGIDKQSALRFSEALLLAVQYAIEMDLQHGIKD
jgi:hypothetical protein